MVYLGADHAGWHLKEEIKKYLQESGYEYQDLGSKDLNPKDDYPGFALEVAKKVAQTEDKGILICSTGIGMCMTANKVKGVRGAVCWDKFTALQSREHNDANILCLASKSLDTEAALKIVRVWLETEFTGEERHVRRLNKVEQIEKE